MSSPEQHALRDRLEAFTLVELRSICRKHKLPAWSSKGDLIERYLRWSTVQASWCHDLVCQDMEEIYQKRGMKWRDQSYPGRSLLPRPEHIAQSAQEEGFHNSPFVDKLALLARHELAATSASTPSVTFTSHVVFSPEQIEQLASSCKSYRILLYCRHARARFEDAECMSHADCMTVWTGSDDESAVEMINVDRDTARPVDVTSAIARSVTLHHTRLYNRYTAAEDKICTLYFTRSVSMANVISRIRRSEETRDTACASTDRACLPRLWQSSTKMTVSLKDLASSRSTRIVIPIRSLDCEHKQCFDAWTYLCAQRRRPSWICPVCSKAIKAENLRVDAVVEEILQETAFDVDQVCVDTDGSWSATTEDGMTMTKGMWPLASGRIIGMSACQARSQTDSDIANARQSDIAGGPALQQHQAPLLQQSCGLATANDALSMYTHVGDQPLSQHCPCDENWHMRLCSQDGVKLGTLLSMLRQPLNNYGSFAAL